MKNGITLSWDQARKVDAALVDALNILKERIKEAENKHERKTAEVDHFLGYTARNTFNGDGWVLLGPKPHHDHLGNYASVQDAQTAGLMHYLIARPEFAQLVASYALYGRGHCHEWFALRKSVEKDGYAMPTWIKGSNDINFSILVHGKPLNQVAIDHHREKEL